MTRELVLRNRQRDCRVDMRLLRRVCDGLLTQLVPGDDFAVGVHLVGSAEMTRLNQTYLHHEGSTDVIAFDYRESAGQRPHPGGCGPTPLPGARSSAGIAVRVQGEIVICPCQAVRQARRFRTLWQAEIVRYAVHGLLHLLGYDDQEPHTRRVMKTVEDRLVRELAGRFSLPRLAKTTPRRPQAAATNHGRRRPGPSAFSLRKRRRHLRVPP